MCSCCKGAYVLSISVHQRFQQDWLLVLFRVCPRNLYSAQCSDPQRVSEQSYWLGMGQDDSSELSASEEAFLQCLSLLFTASHTFVQQLPPNLTHVSSHPPLSLIQTSASI